jgi:HPt (histidine-containing phosphotransfer) domain-containing protein
VARAAEQPFDIVLMDIHMPELDGYGAARAIRAEERSGRRVPIIALTANAMPDEEAKCRDAGMDLQALKPVDWPFLLGAIERLTARRDVQADPVMRSGRANAPAFDQATYDRLLFAVGATNVDKLLRLFVADATSRLETSHARPEPSVLEKDAHSLGGIAGMLGFAALTDACRALHAAIRLGETENAELEHCRTARDLALEHAHKLLGALDHTPIPSLRPSAARASDG